MKQSDVYRENADNCLKLAEGREDERSVKHYHRMAASWLALAHEQDWLDGEIRAEQAAQDSLPRNPSNEPCRNSPYE